MSKLMILKNWAGGQVSFELLEGKEGVTFSTQIEDLAEKIVGDYPEVAKEVVDVWQRRNTESSNLFFSADISPSEKKDLFNAVQELFVSEYSFVDMDNYE